MLTMIVYANTKEKTVLARTHVVQIKLFDALREVARNKYFWIISLATWLGFLEGSQSSILYWLYQYQGSCSAGEYAIIVYIIGDASTWAMLASPFAIRKFGKRRILITTNLLNVAFTLILFPFVQNIWFVLLFMYLNAFVGSFSVVLNPCIEADIRDYQHYITGERIDGIFAVVALMGSVIGMLTQGVLPWLYTIGGITIENAKEMFANSTSC